MTLRLDPGVRLLPAGPDRNPVSRSGVEPVYAANSVGIAVGFVSCPRPASSLSCNSSACDPVLAFFPASPNIVVNSRSDSTPMPVGQIVSAPCQLATAVRAMTRQRLRGDWNAYPLLPLFRQTYAFAYGLACGPPASSTRVVHHDRCAFLTPRMSPRSLTWCRAGSNYNGRHWHHVSFHGRSPPCGSFWPRIRQHWPLFLPPPAASQNHRSPCGSALLARSSNCASRTRSDARSHTASHPGTRPTLPRSAPVIRSDSPRPLNESKTIRRSRMGFVCKSGSQSAAGAFSRERK